MERDEAVRQGIQSFHKTCPREVKLSSSRGGGKSTVTRKSGGHVIPKEIRRWVTRLDNGRCRFCGVVWGNHIHHVKYRSEGGQDEIGNLLSLCLEHHALVHSDKKRYQPLCLGVIWLRNVEGNRTITVQALERKLHERA